MTYPARERVYVELVCSLHDTVVPAAIMSVGFVVSFGIMAFQSGDLVLAVLSSVGVLSSAWRISVVLLGRAEAAPAHLSLKRALHLERRFMVAYYQFAALFGGSTAYALLAAPPSSHMLVVCLVVGYGAGAAVSTGMRPRIAIPSMIMGIVPAIGVLALQPDVTGPLTSALMAALLAGGIRSLLRRYRIASTQMGRRLIFEGLARQDNLTALPNRLALREWFDSHIGLVDCQQRFAVHCLDLDRFKPVNDTFGHSVGDELLKAVARRLTRSLRPTDIAARLGGDEFAVIQRDLSSAQEADALARRLRETLVQPFSIRGHSLAVSTCVGYTVCSEATPSLEELLGAADQALYRAKRMGSGVEYKECPVAIVVPLPS